MERRTAHQSNIPDMGHHLLLNDTGHFPSTPPSCSCDAWSSFETASVMAFPEQLHLGRELAAYESDL